MEKVNVIVGRFQPFTLGHTKGAEYVFKKYGLKTVFCIIDTPAVKVDSRHPFPSDFIITHNNISERWFAGMYSIKNADIGKIAQVCRDAGFEPVIWTCGTDRVKAYKAQAVPKYIDMYNLDPDFQVVEIERSDEDISASKVRDAIKNNDIITFKKMMPSWSHKDFNLYKEYIDSLKESKTLVEYISEAMLY